MFLRDTHFSSLHPEVIICLCCVGDSQGPMKEDEVTPGTIYPLMTNLLFFLPEKLRAKMCRLAPKEVRVSREVASKRTFNRQEVYRYYSCQNQSSCAYT